MIDIELRADLSPLLGRLQSIQREIPFVIASSLTKTALKVRPEIRKEMERAFYRPIRYTLNSIFVKPAKKTDENPTARVWLKDDIESALTTSRFTSGGLAAEYLWPQIAGGSRALKRFEFRLLYAGILPQGMFVVPASGAKLDPNGNMDLGQLLAVLSKLGTIREARSYPGARRRKTKYANAKYFVSRGRGLARGIWEQRPGGKAVPVYLFVSRVSYSKIFRFEEVGKEAALRILPVEFEAAIDLALRE